MKLVFILLCTAIVSYVGVPALVKMVLRRRFLRLVERSENAALTFDDGPNASVTPRLLDLLDRAGVKATFFVIGERAHAYPGVIAEMRNAGHQVAEHSHFHSHPWKSGPIRSAADLWKCSRELDSFGIAGEGRLFRPPFGKLNLMGLLYVWWMKRRAAFWAVDPKDYKQKTGLDVAGYVNKRLGPGAVILLHDGIANMEAHTGRPVVVTAVEQILEEARKRELDLVPLGDLLNGKQREKEAESRCMVAQAASASGVDSHAENSE